MWFWGALVGLVGLLSGCGREVARIPNARQGSFEGSLELADAKPLDVWVHLDIELGSRGTAGSDIALEQDGQEIHRVRCDALNPSVKMSSVVVEIGGKRSLRYDGKMRDCVLTPKHAGPATVRATFAVENAGPLELRDATLFFKK